MRRFFFQIHKLLGLPLSIVFTLWFVSGFFMVFNPRYPRAGATLRGPEAAELSPEVAELRKASLKGVADSLGADLPDVARAWCDAPVERVDTLRSLDIWIPFERWRSELPVLKYYFSDPAHSQLYMTRQGRVIQFTTRPGRRAALLGAIPHWLYFTCLRSHQRAWTLTVEWCALLGCVMCLAGFIYAFMTMWHTRRAAGTFWHNPWPRGWSRLHFISGMAFGLFAITFAYSGYLSMAPAPTWLVGDAPGASRALYSALHRLHFGPFISHEWLRIAVMMILMAGGTLLSVTSLALTLRWLRRTTRRTSQIFKK